MEKFEQHDVGGHINPGEGIPKDKPLNYWEKTIHALVIALAVAKPESLLTVDEVRRMIEGLEPKAYAEWDYYSKWAAAVAHILLERGVISEQELHTEMYGEKCTPDVVFKVGDRVRVKPDNGLVRWRKPHLRCPGYVFGLTGVVDRVVGVCNDPNLLAFRIKGPQLPLYRVSFTMADVWGTCYHLEPEARRHESEAAQDSVVLEIFQSWLEAAPVGAEHSAEPVHGDIDYGRERAHAHAHVHDHDHGHTHDARNDTEAVAVVNEGPDTPGRQVGDALLAILLRRGVVTRDALRRIVEALETAGQQLNGAKLVARAWVDADFKARLLADASAAGAEMGIATSNPNTPTLLIVVENTPTVHNVIVCTLCSCYPSGLLGLSPSWYRSRAYRARCVREPRAVLAEFGLSLPAGVRVVVHDSTADCRFMVIPQRPANTDGPEWTEARLATLVGRDSMVGVALATAPDAAQ